MEKAKDKMQAPLPYCNFLRAGCYSYMQYFEFGALGYLPVFFAAEGKVSPRGTPVELSL
jgi:hypothetical protein